MRVLQIVPGLGHRAEGVGAHARSLAAALAEGHGIDCVLLSGSPGDAALAPPVRAVAARTPDALVRALGAAAGGRESSLTVLLHYANYGYQTRGCPAWLATGLERWVAGAAGRRLVTIFHEVVASGPPWRSSFWLHPVQRRIAGRVARASAALTTSLTRYELLLRRLGATAPIEVTPVFSTIGEPGEVPSASARQPWIVVFGGPGTRRRAYGPQEPALRSVCRSLGIRRIVDVGPPIAGLPPSVAGVPVDALGIVPDHEVRRALARSVAGFLPYPPPFLAKSTVFAALCCHGTVPICSWKSVRPAPPDGGEPPWIHPETVARLTPDDLASASRRARSWYADHDLRRQTARLLKLLQG